MSAGWITEELYARFHTLPAEIKLIMREGCNIVVADCAFAPIGT